MAHYDELTGMRNFGATVTVTKKTRLPNGGGNSLSKEP